MSKRHLLLAIALVAAPGVHAANSDGDYRVWGLGQTSCHSYNKARAGGSDAYPIFIAGYLTSYNAFIPETYSITPGLDMDGILGWLDDFCASRQTTSFSDAMHHMVEEMIPGRDKSGPEGGARWP